ncbi:MAG: sigma-54-dependent Fis family transcriptional regulator [Planctomycetota bacterium]|nr:sigma-54-dependent Fis family transcriptional regulator [Planctomycetota bacterium]
MVCDAQRGFLHFSVGDAEPTKVARTAQGDSWDVSEDEYSESTLKQVLESGRRLVLDEDEDALAKRRSAFELSLRSIACYPLSSSDEISGALYVHSREGRSFGPAELRTLGALTELADAAIRRTLIYDENRRAREEITRLNAKLQERLEEREQELERTREALSRQSSIMRASTDYGGLVGSSSAMSKLTDTLRNLEDTDLPVLIWGESGTGKELVARAIHAHSERSKGPFLAINCGAMPDSLLSAELFGYTKGAFTGATKEKRGLFELADGGTLFLDEVVSMSPDMQKSLLRALERGEAHPLGSEKSRSFDVRVLAAANREMDPLLKSGEFREDLFYRLAVVRINVPPLRERREDIPILIEHFMDKYGNPKDVSFSPGALAMLQSFPWPGNVRQLENEVRRALALGKGVLTEDFFSHLDTDGSGEELSADTLKLSELEENAIRRALELADGQKVKAAQLLGIPRRTLYEKLKKLGM